MVLVASLADHEDLAVRAAWLKVEGRRSSIPDGYPLALVQALNELGAVLLDRDEHEYALAVAAAVLELSQIPEAETVVGGKTEALLALNFRAFAFAGLGLDHEAMHATEDVVDALRGCRDGGLGAQHRDALGRLIVLQGKLELHDEALATADALVDLGRERYAADPEHASDLVLGLNNRYAALVQLGRPTEAAGTLGELTALLERLGVQSRLRVDLLSDLGYLHLELGDPARAVEQLRTAVELGRRLAAADPAMNDSLAAAMQNLAQATATLGEDAMPLLTEIVGLLRPLEEAAPGTHRIDLAKVLNNLAMALMRAGRQREAMAAAAEAVALSRAAAEEDPATLGQVALNLWTFAEVRLAAAEELPEALAAIEESIGLYEARSDGSNARAASGMLADVLDALGHGDRAATIRQSLA